MLLKLWFHLFPPKLRYVQRKYDDALFVSSEPLKGDTIHRNAWDKKRIFRRVRFKRRYWWSVRPSPYLTHETWISRSASQFRIINR